MRLKHILLLFICVLLSLSGFNFFPVHAAFAQSAVPLLVLEFNAGEDILSPENETLLRQNVLPPLQNENNARLEIQSYALAVDEQESAARRLSLKRALAIKAFFLEQGLEEEKIYIRALGTGTETLSPGEHLDRVKLFISHL